MRWPFRRQVKTEQTTLDMPAEVQDYYQADQRERTGVAWLLAFFSLVLTLIIVTGGFFGGRAIYRKVAHKNKKPTVAVLAPAASTESSALSQTTYQSPTTDTSTNTSTTSANPTSSSPSTPASGTSSPSPTPPSTSTQSSSGTVAGQSTTSRSNLPNTGPGNMLGIFLLSSTIGGLGYHLNGRRNQNRY